MKRHRVSNQRRENRIDAANLRELEHQLSGLENVRTFHEADVLEKRRIVILTMSKFEPVGFTSMVELLKDQMDLPTVSVCLESLSDDRLITSDWVTVDKN